MPVYEYKCKSCGHELEVQQRMSDPELTDCDKCGKPALERLISRTAFTLKGGGWYKDLYSSTKPESKSSETKSDAGSSSSDSSAPVAAPAATPAAPAATPSGSGSGSSSGTGGGSSGTKAAAGAS
jgi:putative FmdB family regulatory protein